MKKFTIPLIMFFLLVSVVYVMNVKHKDCSIANDIINQAAKEGDPAKGRELLKRLPSVFKNSLRENIALFFCPDMKKNYDDTHKTIFVSLAAKRAEDGERWFAEGNFKEAKSAFVDARMFLDMSDPFFMITRETLIYEEYGKLENKAWVMVTIGEAQDLLAKNDPIEALRYFAMAKSTAENIEFEIPNLDQIFKDIYTSLGKLLPKTEGCQK